MRKVIIVLAAVLLGFVAIYSLTNKPKSTLSTGKLGMTILPSGGDWSEENYKSAVRTARGAGVSIAQTYYQWGEIERAYDNYSWADPDYDLSIYSEGKLKASVVIKVIDNDELGLLPLDIPTSEFDEQFYRRFENFIYHFLKKYQQKVAYLWIGDNVDNYLHQYPEKVDGFLSFLSRIQSRVQSIFPKVRVGTIIAYQDAKANGDLGLVSKIAKEVDIIGVSFYQTNGTRTFKGTIKEAEANLLEIVEKIKTPKIAITETGWNTNPAIGGSKTQQKNYVKVLFNFLKKHNQRVEFLSFFALHDLPRNLVLDQVSSITDDPKERIKLTGFMNYYGLFDVNGQPKPAWHEWVKQSQAYLER